MIVALQILCVLLLIACGCLARARGWLSDRGTAEISRVLVSLIYPALILTTVPRLSARDLADNAVLPAMAAVIAGAGLALGLLALRLLKPASRDESRAFLFQCVFNNYLFLPLPLVLLLWGERGAALLVFSSVAFEVILWTLGVFLLSERRGAGASLRALLNPAFCTLVVSLGFVVARDATGGESGVGGWWEELARVGLFAAERMGEATVAVSMLVAGSRIATLHPSSVLNRRVWLVAAVRLVVVPALMIPLLGLVPMEEAGRGVLTVVAVMPCAIASVFFSEQFGGDRDFIAGALLLTHIWALVTAPLFLAWAL